MLLHSIQRFLREDDGLETLEWAIVGGLVVAVGAVIFQLLGADASRGLTSLQTVTATIP